MRYGAVRAIALTMGAIAVVAALGLPGQAAEELGPPLPGNPHAVCAQPTFDWGTVFIGENPQHRYVIRNQGTSDLKILRIRESCRCTKKDFTPVIPPGGEGHVTLAIDTQGFKGKVTKSAVAYTNDPKNKEIKLTFGGQVRDFATISPLIPALKGLMGGAPAKTTVTVTRASDVPIRNLTVISESTRLKISVEEKEPGTTYQVHLETVPGLKIANLQETVRLEATANTKKVQLTLTPSIALRQRVEVKPQWVIFRYTETARAFASPPEKVSRALKVTAAEGVTFTITKVETEGDFFSAEIKKGAAANTYQVVVTVTERPKKGPTRPAKGRIRIHTSDAINKVLELRVMGFFKDPDET